MTITTLLQARCDRRSSMTHVTNLHKHTDACTTAIIWSHNFDATEYLTCDTIFASYVDRDKYRDLSMFCGSGNEYFVVMDKHDYLEVSMYTYMHAFLGKKNGVGTRFMKIIRRGRSR